jgi:hypothetical protein
MADLGAFRTATLKPGIDKAIAKDGAQVVLWGDAEEAVMLRHRDAIWSITRHPAIGDEADGPASRVSWLGVSYASSGERVAEFSDAAPLSEWQRFYEEFFAGQQARVRHCLIEVRRGASHAA